jgi:hypothetical protein
MIILKRKHVDVELASGVGMSGQYQLTVRNAEGEVLRQTPWFDNIILDSGLNRMGTGAFILGAAIGTGTSTPVASQTALDAQTTYTTTTGTGGGTRTAQGSSPYYNTTTFVYRTDIGALNGNYSEVGVGWASGSMFSRALIADSGGSPTTITVASTEQLDISYRIRVYPPETDTSGSFTISGTSYTVTGRASNVTTIDGNYGSWYFNAFQQVRLFPTINRFSASNGSLGAITTVPSGTTDSSSATSSNAYVNASLQRTGSLSWDLSSGNLSGGTSCVVVGWQYLGGFQYGFSGAIPKDSTKTLVLNFSVTWARRP